MTKKNKKYVYGAFAATVGLSVGFFLVAKKLQQQKRRRIVADEGYETAHDINFPQRIHRPKRQRGTTNSLS